ncbi:uncharacterized protein M421DRAFT_7096 [Didymella exigua CBS 183.55]|uniref:DRBM domain-containing protein n=1 Tax=Didymella exigua CBS 183.55 TaxID=1150837 RepID=A0A6A5RG92_9PLEO|nr:uncharacterized protein M421DRAFT_7096 [Didymella exigua CBS 183.55]KAF1926493.1 hypothetical protein M421DRAFT_7096 [Didymella exigua CBS 183.55]
MSQVEPWTHQLKQYCQAEGLGDVVYQDVSDRRGGRTAWSTIAVINNTQYPARFWYDGSRIEQAKEDAAEIALCNLKKSLERQRPSASQYQRSLAA